MSGVTKSTSTRRKRQPKQNAEEAGKPARGRPRVEAQDETAADRRRTQIRLAQRAYRLRKETTIASLQKKVDGLKGCIDEMAHLMSTFSSTAFKSGIESFDPKLAQDLRDVAFNFTRLTQQARTELEDTDEQNEQVHPSSSDESHPDQPAPQSKSQASDSKQKTQTNVVENHRGVPIGLGYELMYQEPPNSDEDAGEAMQDFESPEEEINNCMDLSIPIMDFTKTDDAFPIARTPTPITKPISISPISMLPTTFTYSFQESSFARRLHRACLERAFHILSRPGSSYASKAFRLLLPYRTPDQLREAIKARLCRGPTEPLESAFDFPFSHIGGAGTHYIRRTEDITSTAAPDARMAKWLRLQGLDEPVPEPDLVSVPIDSKDFEGVWFDPHDVEGYLAEKGIEIPPEAMFVEGDIAAESKGSFWYGPPVEDNLTEGRTSKLPPTLGKFIPLGGSIMMTTDIQPDQISSTDEDTPMLGFSPSSATFSLPTPPSGADAQAPLKQHVIIDVGKLVDALINHSVCLGRTPGYRRRDVDKALNTAITAC